MNYTMKKAKLFKVCFVLVVLIVLSSCTGNSSEGSPLSTGTPVMTVFTSCLRIEPGGQFDPLDYVIAVDEEGNDLTSNVTVDLGGLDVNEPGRYTITFTIPDTENNVVEDSMDVIVGEDNMDDDDII